MNYGAIGFVIGHEITHGFDDQGRQFDKQGNLVDWWKPDTKTAYLKKAKCIVEQYGNYTEPMTNLKVSREYSLVIEFSLTFYNHPPPYTVERNQHPG